MLDITTLAAWGEFIGGIAVVVSLIYLASQIRQNSKLLQVSTTVALGDSDIEFAKLMIEDPEMSRIFEDGAAARDALSDAQRRKFDAFLRMIVATFQRNFFVEQDGALKASLWEGEIRGTTFILRQPGSRRWWDEWRFTFSDEFGEFVDGLIREGEAAA